MQNYESNLISEKVQSMESADQHLNPDGVLSALRSGAWYLTSPNFN